MSCQSQFAELKQVRVVYVESNVPESVWGPYTQEQAADVSKNLALSPQIIKQCRIETYGTGV